MAKQCKDQPVGINAGLLGCEERQQWRYIDYMDIIIYIYIDTYILGIFYVVEPTSLWEYQGNTIMDIFHILFQVLRVTMFDVCCFVKLWPSNDPLLPILTLVWKGKHSASPHGGD